MPRPYVRKNREEIVSEKRPKRMSMAQQRNTLTFEGQDENYHYHMITDDNDRLQKAEIAGYEYVHSEQNVGDPVVDGATSVGSVVSKPVGGGKTGVLMRIKREWYDEYQQEKDKKREEVETALSGKAREEGNYGGIVIKPGS